MINHAIENFDEYLSVRVKFLDHFADKKKPFYQSKSRIYSYPDGKYSKGYMWEFLSYKNIIHYDTALNLLANRGNVVVLTDLLKPSTVYKPYSTMAVTTGEKICCALKIENAKPPLGNLYIFDNTYSWYICATTEFEKQLYHGDNSETYDYLCMTSLELRE